MDPIHAKIDEVYPLKDSHDVTRSYLTRVKRELDNLSGRIESYRGRTWPVGARFSPLLYGDPSIDCTYEELTVWHRLLYGRYWHLQARTMKQQTKDMAAQEADYERKWRNK
jgi:hypothetical protein